MAYTYDIQPIQTLIKKFIVANFAAQGEALKALPLATTIEHIVTQGTDFPLTVLQLKRAVFADAGRANFITLPVAVHHIRPLTPGITPAILTACTRLSALAAALMADIHLRSVNAGVSAVNRVTVSDLDMGEENPVQAFLTQNNQGGSLVAVSLGVSVDWYEGE